MSSPSTPRRLRVIQVPAEPPPTPPDVIAGAPDPRTPLVARRWWLLSVVAAVVAAAGDVVALLAAHRIYGQETTGFVDQLRAQDVVGLVAVAPLLVVLGARARRGSVRAYTGWLGCVTFTAYSYAIYAFSVHFGPLFPVWVAVLGLSFYALLGALTTGDAVAVARSFQRRAMPLLGGTLVVSGTAFALLWLGQIATDLVAGTGSGSADALLLPTNPVHVLDLALFLPAVLGLSFYALLGALTTGDAVAVARSFRRRAMPLLGGTLVVSGTAFALLWLGQIATDLVAGPGSGTAAALHLPTNPVHVLDLALFLPAVLTSAVLLLRRRALGYVTAPAVLVFLILTCLPVLVTPLMSLAAGRPADWGAAPPMGVVLVASAAVLARALGSARPSLSAGPSSGPSTGSSSGPGGRRRRARP